MIETLEISLETQPRGYANFCCGKLKIFLNTVLEIPIGSKYVPFRVIEDLVEELVIHELIHEITGVHDDKVMDRWHVLLCRMISKHKKCDCPIDCFWRSQTS